MPERRDSARSSGIIGLAYTLVLLLSAYALMINTLTIAGNDYRWVVVQALVCGGLSTAVAVMIWKRVPAPAALVLAACVFANLWTLFDAGFRRLPAVMGW